MANVLNKTVEKDALDALDLLINKVTAADKAMLKAVETSRQLNAGVSGVKTPAGLSAATTENANLTAEIQRQAKAIDQLEKSIVSLSAARKQTAASTVTETVNNRQLLKNATEQARLNSNLIGSYEKLSLQLNIASREALNLGATYGRNSIEFTNAATKVAKLDAEIKALDADIGRNQRNVGNYKSGFNGLGNALNQITRELPAFTFSAQTGFLALSNNIPILTDQIQGLIATNRQLAAEGKPTVSVFKQITSALFSFNTVLALVILGTTLFGDKIAAAFDKISFGSKKLDAAKDSIRLLGEAAKEGAKNAVQELVSLQGNLEIAKDVNLSYKERLIAVENLQKQYPFYFENLTKEQILAGDTAKAERELTEAIIARAKANAAVAKITENESKIIDIEQRQLEITQERIKAQKDLQREQAASNASSGGQLITGTNQNQFNAKTRLAQLDKEEADNKRTLIYLNGVNNKLTSYTLEQQKTAIGLDYQQEKGSKAKNRAKIEEVDILIKLNEQGNSLLFYLQEYQKELEREQAMVSRNSEQWKQYQKAIDRVKESIKGLTDAYTSLKEGGKAAEEDFNRKIKGTKALEKSMEDLRKKTREFLDGFSEGFLDQNGLGGLTMFFDDTFNQMIYGAETTAEKFQVAFAAISEAGQQLFNFLSKLSQENFEAEYARVERQKDIAIAFAGESEAAKVEAAEQAEKQKNKIREREAQAEKKLRLFNAIIDTAQAVVAALPNIPLSILVGLLGAAQIAAISSQQIPAFWEGGVHTFGGAMRVNDDPKGTKGGNYKEVVKTPSGSVIRPVGKDVTMSAPAGSQIFPTYEAYEQHLRELDSILHNTGITPTRAVASFAAQAAANTLTPEQYFNGVARTEAAIRNFQPIHITKDRRGEIIHTQGQNGRTQSMNNRLHITGKINP